MERARKMVLIPQESLQKMQTNVKLKADQDDLGSVQTVGDKFKRLDNEMKEILDSQTYNTEGDKYKNFLQVLQRYLFLVDEKRKSSEAKKVGEQINGVSDDYIISSVPKVYQNKTKLLLNHLKNNKTRISWNDNGLVTIDGEKISSSNIIDLLNDAARARKKVKAIGRAQFAELLRSTETPNEFIGNEEYLNNVDDSLTRSRFEKSLEKRREKSRGKSFTEEDSDTSSLLGDTVVPNKNRRKSITTSTPLSKNWRSLRSNK